MRHPQPQLIIGHPNNAIHGMTDAGKQPLTLELAAYVIARALNWQETKAEALGELQKQGRLKASTLARITDRQALTNGEVFMLVKDLLDSLR